MGMFLPLTTTLTPFNFVGSGTSLAEVSEGARLEPKIEMIEPTAAGTGEGAKLAELTIPPLEINGRAVNETFRIW